MSILSKQHHRYLKVLSFFVGVLYFIFLQIIRLGDTTEYHFLFTNDFSWQAYWQFYISTTSLLFLVYALIVAVISYWLMIGLIKIWQYIYKH